MTNLVIRRRFQSLKKLRVASIKISADIFHYRGSDFLSTSIYFIIRQHIISNFRSLNIPFSNNLELIKLIKSKIIAISLNFTGGKYVVGRYEFQL